MNQYFLFVDELGIPDPKDTTSDIYVLTGIAVKKEFQNELKINADHIKFKYWNRTNIVFHSREIGNNLKTFNIFKNNQALKNQFLKDLLKYLSISPINVFSIVTDKKIARTINWNYVKVLKESIRLLYYNFLTFLLGKTNCNGKIVVESASAEKDVYYLKFFAYYTSPHCKELNVDYKIIRNILTSIFFVTKRNFDIEEQIADLLSYAGKCKYKEEFQRQQFLPNSYENHIIKVYNSKIFSKPKNLKASKLKFYKKVDSFVILPKK